MILFLEVFSTHDLKYSMLMNDLTCWFFTESRLREANPYSRFETEMLNALDEIDAEIDSAERGRIRKLVLERTEQVFQSDLSWGQNIYSRENLRWVSFIAGYVLAVRENLEDPQPFLQSLENKIRVFSKIRFFPLWVLVSWTIIFMGKIIPRRSLMRKVRVSNFLTVTYLPFTSASNWTLGYDSFYERFFTAHSCSEMSTLLSETADRWKSRVYR